MDPKDALVVQVIGKFCKRFVESIDLGPINGVEKHRAENPVLQLEASLGGNIIGQENRSDGAESPPLRAVESLDRHLVKISEVTAVWLCIHHVATDEMFVLWSTSPLEVEKIFAVKREWPQHDHVGVHPQSAMLVKDGVTEYIAEVPYL